MQVNQQRSYLQPKSFLQADELFHWLTACVLEDFNAHGPFPQCEPQDVFHDAFVKWLEDGCPPLTKEAAGKLANTTCSAARSKFAKRQQRDRSQEFQWGNLDAFLAAGPEPWQLADESECRATLSSALQTERAKLTDRQNRILDLKFAQDLTFREIGETLGIPHQQAHREYSQALRLLRPRFAAYVQHFDTIYDRLENERPRMVPSGCGTMD